MEGKMNIKFMWNGIKVDGQLYRAWYSGSKLINYPEGTITIYAKNYKHFPAISGLTIQNDSDIRSDYCENDRIRITPENSHYPAVLEALRKLKEHNAKRKYNCL